MRNPLPTRVFVVVYQDEEGDSGTYQDRYTLAATVPMVREHYEKLWPGRAVLSVTKSPIVEAGALDIVNLPRVVASASAPIQGTKREVGS